MSEWISRHDEHDEFPDSEYRPVWFVASGRVHTGHSNGKFFWSHEDTISYHESEVSHFMPMVMPEPPHEP